MIFEAPDSIKHCILRGFAFENHQKREDFELWGLGGPGGQAPGSGTLIVAFLAWGGGYRRGGYSVLVS